MASDQKTNTSRVSAQALLLNHEDPEELQAMLDDYLADFHPTGPAEHDLVEEMVGAKWRQRRVWAIESRWMQGKIEQYRKEDAKEFKGLDEAGHLALAVSRMFGSLQDLGRFEARFERAYSRALKNLLQLQRVRRTGESKRAPAPKNLQNEPNGPSRNGQSTPAPSASECEILSNTCGSFGGQRHARYSCARRGHQCVFPHVVPNCPPRTGAIFRISLPKSTPLLRENPYGFTPDFLQRKRKR